MDGRDWLLVLALSVLWGGAFLFAGIAVATLPPLTLVLARVAIAASLVLFLVGATGSRLPRDRGSLLAFAVMGTLNNLVPFTLLFWAQTRIDTGLASILNATTPLFAVLIGAYVLRREPAGGRRLGGVLLGIVGVAVILAPGIEAGTTDLWAEIACLAAALSYATAGHYGRRFRDLPPLVTAAGQLCATTLLTAPIVALVDAPWRLPPPSGAAIASVLALAALSTALAYVIYFTVLARAGATNILLVTLLVPVTAVLLGAVVLGERLGASEIAGMAVVGLGLLTLDGRAFALIRRRSGADPIRARGPSG